jgi:hypothetical protein
MERRAHHRAFGAGSVFAPTDDLDDLAVVEKRDEKFIASSALLP